MKTLKRIAKPCGIVGGVWGLLAPILVLLPVTSRGITPPVAVPPGHDVLVLTRPVLGWGKEMVSMVEAGVAGDALPVLSAIAAMGLLGLSAILVIKRRPHLKVALLWVSALVMLIASLLSIFSVGLYFLPASVLLLLAAIGIRKKGEAMLVEVT